MLDDISAVRTWDKVNQGMLKMYRAEVLGKLPVSQYFLFGSLLPWDGPMPPSREEADDACGHGHAHAHGDMGGAGQREVGWGDCCGIPVPSVFGAAAAAAEKNVAPRLTGPNIRPVPFD